MRAHASRRLKCRVRVRGKLRWQWRVLVRCRVRVRVRFQEAPGAEPTAGQWSPRRAEFEGTRDGASQDPSLAVKATQVDKPLVEEASGILSGAAAWPGKRHGELPGALPSQPAPLLDPRRVMLSDVGIGSP